MSWTGHVRRMPDTRVPKQLLYAELSSGKRKTGGQWKRYKDQLKANLKKCDMDLQWETTADDRAYWRMGVANLERRRIITEAEKRERRKNREYDNDTADSAVCVCNVCGRICRSAIGLYSHQRTHRTYIFSSSLSSSFWMTKIIILVREGLQERETHPTVMFVCSHDTIH